MSLRGNEKFIDDPVIVNGKFVRNVGTPPDPSIYQYIYLKDGDKDLIKRATLAIKIGAFFGVTVGTIHVSSFGRNPVFATKFEPLYKIAYSCGAGILAQLIHAGTVSISSQLQGGRDLVRNWVLGGATAAAFVHSVVRITPQRQALMYRVPLLLTFASGMIKVAVVYDKPLEGHPVTTYGATATELTLGPRHYDTLNPYRKQEEYYLEKFL